MDDTIAAIATALGEGGIAIIRVSGPRALTVADALFQSGNGAPSTYSSHTIHLGRLQDPRRGELIDQVMLSVMRAPRTYTGEDTIEINCHGSPLVARAALGLCLDHGARLAEPGEFTKRAFLNGKLDLTQAEAVMDLIAARTTRAQAAATRAIEGRLSAMVNAAREKIIQVLAHLEAHLDFPDDDIRPDTTDHLMADLADVVAQIEELLQTAREGRILRHGVAMTIVGRPNAGKSSLMNALLGHDRAIVTESPGTTRDTIEDTFSVAGIPIKLTDTAGIRSGRSAAERIGVERSHKALEGSDIAIHLIDGSRPLSKDDDRLAQLCAGRLMIRVINKSDLPQRVKLADLRTQSPTVKISAKTGAGLDKLREQIAAALHVAPSEIHHNEVFVNERHEKALRSTTQSLTNAIDNIRSGVELVIIAQEIRSALDEIGHVVGKTTTDDILDRVFSLFCIGK